jgi:hypothetical protein
MFLVALWMRHMRHIGCQSMIVIGEYGHTLMHGVAKFGRYATILTSVRLLVVVFGFVVSCLLRLLQHTRQF